MEDKMSYNVPISDSWLRSIAPELRKREGYWTRLINLDIHSFHKAQIINIMVKQKDFSERIRANVMPSMGGKKRVITI